MSGKAITAATTHFIQFRIQYASIAVIYWDYLLTFPNEAKYLWHRRSMRRLSTGLYVLCRYALVANVLYLLAIADKLGASCNTWYKFIGAISVVARAAVLTVFTMRTYAMWSRNKFVLYGLGALALTCVVLDCLHVPGLRCEGSLSIQIANTLLSILMCVFEFISTVLTTFRCVQAVKEAGSIQSQKRTLTVLILEQGVLYFGLVTSITIAAVILNFRAPKGFFQRLLNALILPLSGLLTARFLLHLQAWDNRAAMSAEDGSANTTAGAVTTTDDVVFARQSTIRATDQSFVSEFGDDPVVSARLGSAGHEMTVQIQHAESSYTADAESTQNVP